MKPTRRGYAVACVAVAAVAAAYWSGPRALNAVVLSAAVALAAAGVQVWALSEPTVRRDPPADGFPGETRDVRLAFETDAPFTGVVSDQLSAGLTGDADGIETAVGVRPVEYPVTLDRRGRHEFGPVRVVGRDVLGLVETTFVCPVSNTVVVYPRLHDLTASARHDLRTLYAPAESRSRDEFDRLREYAPGDPLRDVHWKSSAKRDELVVKEFASDAEAEAVTLAAGAADGRADEMAEAAASIGVVLLESDAPVSVATPDGEVTVSPDDRAALLEHLAVASAGRVPDRSADVTVYADAEATEGRIGDVETTFDRLAGTARRGVVRADAEATAIAGGP